MVVRVPAGERETQAAGIHGENRIADKLCVK